MITVSIPPFTEGTHFRQLHPTKEGGRRWRYVTTQDTFLPLPRIVFDGAVITLHSADGREWARFDEDGVTLRAGYAWNGCSPKRWVWPFGWVGTVDFPSTILASAYHDMFYQFARTQHFPLNRSDVDAIFYHMIVMAGSPKIASIYHGAVKKFGSWADKPRMGEYSKIL